MKAVFAGTRGYIDIQSPLHERHSSLLLSLLSHQGKTLLIDCGEDWLDHLEQLSEAQAVIITHAHPDHAGGLKHGWDRPVWATEAAWETMKSYPLEHRHVLPLRSNQTIAGFSVEAFPVQHSLRAPAVGLRLEAEHTILFYVPDVVYIEDKDKALQGVDLYIGDGASLKRSLVRKHGDALIGHAPIQTQLTWCAKAGINRAYFTHCGSEIVADHESAAQQLRELATQRGVDAHLAYDGLELTVRPFTGAPPTEAETRPRAD